MFNKDSRYAGLPELTWRAPDGRQVVYVGRRMVPRRGGPDPLPPVGGLATVRPGERLDNLSARTLAKPDLFWKVCDSNAVLDPFALSGATGTVVEIPEE